MGKRIRIIIGNQENISIMNHKISFGKSKIGNGKLMKNYPKLSKIGFITNILKENKGGKNEIK